MRRTAVVTGGANGMGGAIVRALTETGHEVATLDRSGEFAVDLADADALATRARCGAPTDPEVRRRRPGGDPCQPWRFGRPPED